MTEREAAVQLAKGLDGPVVGPDDRVFKGLDRRLRAAAVGYTRGMTKRGYSREFTPRTDRRIKIEIDRVPPTLNDALRAKAKREGVSLRTLTLRLWRDWIESRVPPREESQ